MKGRVFVRSKQNNCSRTKRKLFELKRRGVPEVTWRLDYREKAELERVFPIIPCICRIRTKRIYGIDKNKSALLRKIDCSNQKGERTIIYRVKSNRDIELLEKNEVQYKPINCRIILN